MSKNEKLIILCNALNTLALAMGAVFMNVYLYTYTGSLTVMALYTCIRMSMYPFCFTLAGKMARKISIGTTLTKPSENSPSSIGGEMNRFFYI